MNYLDIIVPVKNEQDNVTELIKRIHKSLKRAEINYGLIFVDDNSTDKTFGILQKLSKKYPLIAVKKKGQPGKAYSILEAIEHTKGENLAMIDGDLQYPPEAIPEMYQMLSAHGVIVAKRKNYEAQKLRKIASRAFNYTFGKLLFDFKVDVQSGLKLFKREIIDQINIKDVSGWTLDLPLLITARNMGHKIGEVEIDFEKRINGESKIKFSRVALELAWHSLKHKLKNRKVYRLAPKSKDSMVQAGVAHNGKRYVTHSTLNPNNSAIRTIHGSQKFFLYLFLAILGIGAVWDSLFTLQLVIALLSSVYFIDVIFNFFLIFKSLHHPPEISINGNKISSLKLSELPIYSILCPLYKEGNVLPNFLEAISKIDWPKKKLDVMLLLEEDDSESIEIAKSLKMPFYVRTVIVPNSNPKTKPKACNYGLSFAKGEYLVIYDAEDLPDPQQLKKAYIAFKEGPRDVVCLQAKLNYHNPHQNFLTRLFTAEYSLWFDVILTGLQSIQTSIPLGGTSNHFRTRDLLSLEGWDPFNVTEDCDLGIRLFQEGYKTAVIDSITLEEANSNLGNWVRQRSRWIKGYMQTYLVHMRNPIEFTRKQGVHSLIFQLVVGGKIAFMFINPLLWLTTIVYFTFRAVAGPYIEAVYPSKVFYMAAFSLVTGNFLFLYYYMIGCAKRGHWTLIKFVYLVPFYWLAVSYAACIALYQLIFKPHYWEKTVHGLHIKKELEKLVQEVVPAQVIASDQDIRTAQSNPKIRNKLADLFKNRRFYFGASMLVFASVISNLLNFIFNAYLGRHLSLEDFGNLSLFSSLLYLCSIPLWALSATITQKIAYLFGKYSKEQAKGYLSFIVIKTLILGGILSGLWILAVPLLSDFFNVKTVFPLLAFTPIWLIGVVSANFGGYLRGTLSFGILAFAALAEAVTKLVLAFLIVQTGANDLVYLAIPASLLGSMVIQILFINGGKSATVAKEEVNFNFPFYASAFLNSTTTVNFLTLDVVLVKHFLTPLEAGQYALLALVGKMTFFFGSLLGPFMLPIVSRNEGAKKDSQGTFLFLFSSTALFSFLAFFFLGVWGDLTVPVLFGSKTLPILPLLPIYVMAMVMFTLTQPIITFFQAKQNYAFAVVAFLVSIFQVILISQFHASLEQIVWVMMLTGALNLSLMGFLFLISNYLWVVQRAGRDLFDLFFSSVGRTKEIKILSGEQRFLTEKRRILVFNWRDVKHKWAGGAETYLNELSKKWIQDGNSVTIFCGNDGKNPRYEVIEGIQIIRRGGFYTVYLWALLYYTLRFKGKFDFVIDSENGIPFFTPLYVRGPKFLLIHHIHQEVFRQHLPYPLAVLARFMEGKLMPIVYKNQKVITVSESSREEILKLSKNYLKSVDIVNPGIHQGKFIKLPKTENPSFLYLGRLQPYKNIDVAIRAFQNVVAKYPSARFNIAGSGQSLRKLTKLTKKLGLLESVKFLGRVSETKKSKLLATSWVMIQPSMIEGWGITVIEANACGTPVIAANVNGLRDSIVDGKTGILVKPKSTEEFAQAMFKVINESDLRDKLSNEALAWSKNFSWEKSADDFFRSILNLADSGSNETSFRRLVLTDSSNI